MQLTKTQLSVIVYQVYLLARCHSFLFGENSMKITEHLAKSIFGDKIYDQAYDPLFSEQGVLKMVGDFMSNMVLPFVDEKHKFHGTGTMSYHDVNKIKEAYLEKLAPNHPINHALVDAFNSFLQNVKEKSPFEKHLIDMEAKVAKHMAEAVKLTGARQ